MSDRRILVVSQMFPPEMGGNASRTGEIARRLEDDGWEVTAVAPAKSYPPGEYERSWSRHETERWEDMAVHRLWTWQPVGPDPGILVRLAYYLVFAFHAMAWVTVHADEYDAIVTTAPPIFTALSALPAAVLKGNPLFVDQQDLWIEAAAGLGFIEKDGLLARLSRLYQSVVFAVAERIFVTTDEMDRRLRRRYRHVGPEKTVPVPNGVDTTEFTPADDPPDDTLVFCGHVGHPRAIPVYLEAMTRMENDVRLRVVGGGDRLPAVKRRAEELGIQQNVTFHGTVDGDRVPELVADSTVGIAPIRMDESLEYSVPIKVYEYMSCGLPVVATDIGAVTEFMDESGGGVAVENDPDAVADALDALLDDRRKRRRFGQRGRAFVRDRYDWTAIGKHLSDTIRRSATDDTEEAEPIAVAEG